MTAYTVVLAVTAPQPPTQQPFPATQSQEDTTWALLAYNVSAADKPAALVAGILAYQTAWAAAENAKYTGTESQNLQPGLVPTYGITDAPAVHFSTVLTGTATQP
jgi:hypothetical protein